MYARLATTVALCAATASSFAKMPAADTVKNGADHPLVSRYQDAMMVGYDVKQYDTATFVAGKVNTLRAARDGENIVRREGKYTRIAYLYPTDRSSLEVFRNYQAALEKAGLKTVYACALEECGKAFGNYKAGGYLGSDGFIKGGVQYSNVFRGGGARHPRYLLATGTQPGGGRVDVSVYVTTPDRDKAGGIYLQILEGTAMEGGKVTASLSAGDMAKSLAGEGRVALYGVYFDTGRSDVKPDSKPMLAEMAKLLRQDPKLKVHVVGHTDNQGSLAHNLDLSQKRAEAVVKALTGEYDVDAKRLSAKGVASYAPVASNDAEAGREKNRRVELVKQ